MPFDLAGGMVAQALLAIRRAAQARVLIIIARACNIVADQVMNAIPETRAWR